MTKEANFAQGMIKVKENDHFGAIELFTLVLNEDPEDANALSQRAVAYLNLERYDESMADMNAAIKYDPDYSYRYQCRGYLKARLNDPEGAIADYQKAVDLDPEDSIALNNLALAQEQMGWAGKAQQNFDKSDLIAGIKTAKERSETRLKEAEKKKEEMPETKATEVDKAAIAKSVFTKKNSFNEFIRFIRNGFKLDKDDKS